MEVLVTHNGSRLSSLNESAFLQIHGSYCSPSGDYTHGFRKGTIIVAHTELDETSLKAPARIEHIAQLIFILRKQRVLLDTQLAELYGVTTKRLNEQVRRNLSRFPTDFMFQVTEQELAGLRSQIATSNPSRGGRRYAPYAFTEHGTIMAAMVLNSPRAVEMSVFVVRAFVQLRELLASNLELSKRLDELETRLARELTSHDHAIAEIIKTIRQLMQQPEPKKRPIGFMTNLGE